jgi:hypothetical protein
MDPEKGLTKGTGVANRTRLPKANGDEKSIFYHRSGKASFIVWTGDH